MIDKQAIEAIQTATAIQQAMRSVEQGAAADNHLVPLPDGFTLHDIERHMPTRRRQRGAFNTFSINSFATYTHEHKEAGATVFVNADDMSARAVLDLGNSEHPGHCDHTATVKLKSTAAYDAMLKIAHGLPIQQLQMIEFVEDWRDIIQFSGEGGPIEWGQALAAIRKLTVEAARKVEASQEALSASKSTFEQVKVSSDTPVPTVMAMRMLPYHFLTEYVFDVRISVLTSTERPMFALRVIGLEEHKEEMAKEFAILVNDAITQAADADGEDAPPVVLGTFTAGK